MRMARNHLEDMALFAGKHLPGAPDIWLHGGNTSTSVTGLLSMQISLGVADVHTKPF